MYSESFKKPSENPPWIVWSRVRTGGPSFPRKRESSGERRYTRADIRSFQTTSKAFSAVLARRPWMVLIALTIGLQACDGRSKGEQHYWAGHAYQEQGMTANALREYRSAVAAGVDSPAAYYELGALYGEKDEHGKAIAAYRELLERWPEESRAQELLAARYVAAGQPTAAVSLYRTLLDQGGDPAALLGRLGDAQSLNGDLQSAAQSYGDLLVLRPDSSRARYQLARIYKAEGRAEPAIAAYVELLEQKTYARQAALGLADLLIELDRRNGELGRARAEGWWRQQGLVGEEAMQKAEEILAEKPGSSADLWGLGKLLFWQGRYREALTCVAKLAETTPDDYRVHFFLSKLYGLLGEEEAAREAFAQYQHQEQRAKVTARVQTERDVLLKQLSGEIP